MPKLTPEMKTEIIGYCVQYTKGVIEDDHECPCVAGAFDRKEVKSDDLEDFVDKCREALQVLVQEGKL